MLLSETPGAYVLAGSADEITNVSHLALTRFGIHKRLPAPGPELPLSGIRGAIGGEGAAFFLLSANCSNGYVAMLEDLVTFYETGTISETEDQIAGFLHKNSVTLADIDLVLLGRSGDPGNDKIYDALEQSVFKGCDTFSYKQLCGEYPTSSSFALWLATGLISKELNIPGRNGEQPIKDAPDRVMIYNNYLNRHHSLMLVTSPHCHHA
jgi:hypothetical protein